MGRLRAQSTSRIWGTESCWSASAESGLAPSQIRTVQLEVVGDDRSGYHLVMSPDGFCTADGWYASREEALDEARAIFGVAPEDWRESR